MDAGKLAEAARILLALRRRELSLDHLPASCQPADLDEAHAIQEAAIRASGEAAVGWKMSVTPDGDVMRGAILSSRRWSTPARIPAALTPLLGVECEIAFRLDRDLPPRGHDYSREEIEAAVTALPAIEIVDSRFVSYQKARPLDRTADFMSNGGFIEGPANPGWRTIDLSAVEVTFTIDGDVALRRAGGHGAGHPLIPAIALINEFRKSTGIAAGKILTTGTYTGLVFVKPGQTVAAQFAGFGKVEASFV